MINWTIINRTDYENQRYNFLLQTEERGEPKLVPYNDGIGNITIGVGFNLEGSAAVRNEVLRTFGLIRNNPVLSATPPAPGQLSAQQIENNYIDQIIAAIGGMVDDPSQLNSIMATRATDTRLSALGTRRSTFTFNDAAEIRGTFDRLMTDIYEPKVNSWLSGIPDSKERVALASLAWNQKDSNPLLASKLKAAVVNGDRAEAWYEIRYNSNSASQPAVIRNGIAKRRYFEADTFGLYNNAAVNNDADAKGAFRTYTRHKTTIDSYDAQFGAQVTLANSDYNTTITQTRAVWFQPARDYLVTQYGQGITIGGDILVGEDQMTLYYKGTDADALNGSTQNDLIFGESGDDLIDGSGGEDVLYGGTGEDVLMGGSDSDWLFGGYQNDTLHGGAGDDRLTGGTGFDIYVVKRGEGADTIVDSDGKGVVLFDGHVLFGGKKNAGDTVYRGGGLVYSLAGQTLTITIEGGDPIVDGSIIINNFNKTRKDLGITLAEEDEPNPAPPLPAVAPIPLGNAARIPSVAFPSCPLVLDLDGNGLETTGILNGTHFDHNGDGFRETTGWVQGGDGLLVWDRNGNSQIDSGAELFGSATPLTAGGNASNGFIALADLDQNGDGKVDNLDPAFSNLRIWKDVDQNGRSTSGELLLLADAGVQAINTAYELSTLVDSHGNEHRQVGTFVRADGTTGETTDVWFRVDLVNSEAVEELPLADDIKVLPDAKGFGVVYDLRQAMARDTSGALKTLVQSFVSETDPALRIQKVEQIILRWTGSENVAPDPVVGDLSKKVHATEQFVGQAFPRLNGNLNQNAVLAYNDAFNQIAASVYAQLNSQSHLTDLYSRISYSLDSVTGVLRGDLALVQSEIQNRITADPVGGRALLSDFSRSVVGFGLERAFNYWSFYEYFRNQSTELGDIVATAGRTILDGTSASETLSAPWVLLSGGGSYKTLMPTIIAGRDGNDYLTGGDVNDALFGENGDDALSGGLGDDFLDGGTGNDSLIGELGNDTYAFGRGYGSDVIHGARGDSSLDTLIIGSGIVASDVMVSRDYANLYIGIAGTPDQLKVDSFFHLSWVTPELYQSEIAGTSGITDGSLTDDPTWSLAAILNQSRTVSGTAAQDTLYGWLGADVLSGLAGNDWLYGDVGDDVLYGGDGADILKGFTGNDTLNGDAGDDRLYGDIGEDMLDGGLGNDYLDGGVGNDIYLFGRGSGQDTIQEYDTDPQNVDTVRFAADISPSDVVAFRSWAGFYLAISGTTDKLTFGISRSPASEPYRIELVEFADGTVWDSDTLMAMVNFPTEALDILEGTEFDDFIDSLGGNDTVLGYAGDDFLVGGVGNDFLYGGDGNDNLDGGDGKDEVNGDAGDDILRGGEGNDWIIAGAGADTLDGGGGNDNLRGGTGDDTYFFGRGSGSDSIRDDDGAANQDVIRLTGNITQNDIWITRSAFGLGLIIKDTGESISVESWFSADIYRLARVEFTDGSNLDMASLTILANTPSDGPNYLIGTSGDDTINGLGGDDQLQGKAGNDTFDGGVGNDSLQGDIGNDIYLFESGWGQDTILDYDTVDGELDIVRFGASVAVHDILPGRGDSNSLYLMAADSTDRIFMPFAGGDMVERIEFADGTTWDSTFIASITNGLTLNGTTGSDVLVGQGRDDVLNGGAGSDTMLGRFGDDTYWVDNTGDTVTEAVNEGVDTVNSSVTYALPANVENLTLVGAASVNGTGNSLNNVITGNSAANVLTGGSGNDTYVVDSVSDSITELADEGADTVQSEISYALGANLENLTLTGTLAINGTGNDLDNVLTGNGASNVLTGGLGNDTYYVGAGDTVTEAANGGADTVMSDITWTLDSNVENLTLLGTAAINVTGNALNNTLIGNAGDNVIDGGVGTDTMSGGAGNDTYWVDNISDVVVETANGGTDALNSSVTYALQADIENMTLIGDLSINGTGNALNNILVGNVAVNTLDGGAGADTMNGGAGADTMSGGLGDDMYIVDNPGDMVVESPGQGTDTIQASISFSLSADVESLDLTGAANISGTGNNLANSLTGNSGDNVLDGGAGADTMAGSMGNDTYVVDSVLDSITELADEGADTVQSEISYALGANLENLTLTGTLAINGTGNDLDNVLIGNGALNMLTGGLGNDTYNVGAGDTVTEAANGGADTVMSDITWTLDSNVENLTLLGTATTNGTGNDLDNVLIGNGASNVLAGGLGNDTYYVGAGDTVTEAANGGADTVMSDITWTLGSNVENLTLLGATAINGTGNSLNNILVGNSANNTLGGSGGNDTLDGGAGADSMSGGAGNDTYVVDNAADVVTESSSGGTDTVYSSVSFTLGTQVENLTLTGVDNINATGNTLNNILVGNAGNNVLNGGSGADNMSGGAGDDSYVVANANDIVVEATNEGIDLIQSSVTYTLSANVENLTLTGTSKINGTGNSLDNSLTGNTANNTLNGGAGNDTLSGGGGSDTLVGNMGDDTYVVDSTGDVVTELAGEGDDTVSSSITYTLGTNVENLTLTGASLVNGTGNAADNVIYGNAVNNTLTGGSGNDLLNGGTGSGVDTLVGDAGNDVLEGMDGNDSLSDASGNNYFNGGAGTDTLTGNGSNEIFIGGAGNDTVAAGTGADIIAFNRGDGQDSINASTGQDNTVSLGGGIAYSDLYFKQTANDLVLETGNNEQLTFNDWYTAPDNRSVLNLQAVAEAMAGFDANATDPLLNQKVQRFDFSALVNQFDQAKTADPLLDRWALANSLLDAHLAGSDTEALGGDLAYRYGVGGTLSGIGFIPAQGILSNAQFGSTPQALQPLAGLQDGLVRLS